MKTEMRTLFLFLIEVLFLFWKNTPQPKHQESKTTTTKREEKKRKKMEKITFSSHFSAFLTVQLLFNCRLRFDKGDFPENLHIMSVS